MICESRAGMFHAALHVGGQETEMSWKAAMTLVALTSVVLAGWGMGGCSAETPADRELPEKFRRLVPLHTRLGRPRPGDWLDQHPEPGQTYREYVRSYPLRPDARRRVIYIQPLGTFNGSQRKIIDLAAEFMGIYFGLPVKVREDISLDVIPAAARRTHPVWGDEQILTSYVLERVLPPRMPKDAVVFLSLTTSDLWPGEGWNFVFGQASLNKRVGVWSIYRNADPTGGDRAFQICLRQTLQTATHETGHMFSMLHCTMFECNMCGSNSRAESERRPLALCPHCLAKLCYATGVDPVKRCEKLIGFYHEHGMAKEEAFDRKVLAALRQDEK
jgi:archaemetzincin